MRVKLEEVCKRIYAGGDVPKDRYSEEKTEDYKVPIFANAEKDEGLYGYTDEAREKELSITVAARGTIGYTVIRREPFLPVVRLITVVPDLEKVSERYLFYALKMCKPQSSGTSIPQLTVPDIKKNTLNLLDIAEQESIANRLDKLNGIMKLRTEVISKLDELIRARFVEMFGDPVSNNKKWIMNTFGEICSVRQGLQIPISKRLINYEDGCYEYITVQYINGGKDREYIKNPKSTVICTEDDILMTRTGNTGKVITGVRGVFHNNFFKIEFDRKKYNNAFIEQYLNLDFIQADIIRRAGVSTIPDLNHGEFYRIKIFEPPIELQNKFATFVEQVNKSKVEVQKALDKAQLLFDSLMQKYFG